jgi:dephospho-CoA kinase
MVIAEIPLLFETGHPWGFAATVLVYAPEAVQLARLMARDRLDEPAARARLAAQLPIEEKRALADHVIDNGGDRAATEGQVADLYRRLQR